ncbi:MAG: hypothetical protein EPN56_05555 [Rhodanobacter sp.]|nr:MAG: hypothetical protein EPN78_01260 [Rhodanobacter sp.]TAM15091.1 MAG: hypothetical protein EPN66_00630 [Rhodanobacter sp.]TAM36439.1 MAG: hypothetical protein EPN56_05555 [Rhodanobacter sp.]
MRIPALLVLLAAAVANSACAQTRVPLTDAALRAYAASPVDKAATMGQTVSLGTHAGTPVVVEFPCADVCPQYTVRIIHYQLAPGTDCAAVGGVEKKVLVPVAITVLPRTFCVPKVLADGGYETR